MKPETILSKYKKRLFYDLEVLPYDFTNTVIDDDKKRIIVYCIFDKQDENGNFLNRKIDFKLIENKIKEKYPEYKIKLFILNNDTESHKTLRAEKNNFINFFEKGYEYIGWNSQKYDMPLLCLMYAYFDVLDKIPNARDMRRWSNYLIDEELSSYQLFKMVAKTIDSDFLYQKSCDYFNQCLSSLRHIDAGKLNEKACRKGMPPSLKSMASFTGDNVLDDETTRLDFEWSDFNYDSIVPNSAKSKVLLNKTLTQEGIEDLIIYNINDVIVTANIFSCDEYKGNLEIKDLLRKQFPFTLEKLNGKSILPRDATMPRIAGKIMIGKENYNFKDIKNINYFYNINGKSVDLLEYMCEKENYFSPIAKEFFLSLKGKQFNTYENLKESQSSSSTGKNFCNIPLFFNQKSTSAYATITLGGIHGGIDNSIYGKSKDDVFFKSFSKKTPSKNNNSTIDINDVIHLDFTSFYPSLAIAMGIYKKDNGVDNLKTLTEERIKIKNNMDLDDFESDDYKKQKALKELINSVIGSSNLKSEYSDLPLDNTIQKARLIGNMMTYVLSQRFSNEGAFVFSINTDGIYCCNISEEKAKSIAEDFCYDYDIEIEPEYISRMVNKDTNNRIEFRNSKNKATNASGDMRFGVTKKMDLTKSPNYPLIVSKVAIEYFENKEDALDSSININLIKKILTTHLKNNFNPIEWTKTLKGKMNAPVKKRKVFFIEDKNKKEIELQETNRIIFTKKGNFIKMKVGNKEQKIPNIPAKTVEVVNEKDKLNHFLSDNINLEAYSEMVCQLLNTYLSNINHIIEIDGEIKQEETEQLTLELLYKM